MSKKVEKHWLVEEVEKDFAKKVSHNGALIGLFHMFNGALDNILAEEFNKLGYPLTKNDKLEKLKNVEELNNALYYAEKRLKELYLG